MKDWQLFIAESDAERELNADARAEAEADWFSMSDDERAALTAELEDVA
jgi:hypothetical protein